MRNPGTRYRSSDRRRALALYRSGLSAAAVEAVTGVSFSTVCAWARAEGVARSTSEANVLRHRRAARRRAEVVLETARLVHGEGLTQAAAAARLGVHPETVRRRLRHEANPYRSA